MEIDAHHDEIVHPAPEIAATKPTIDVGDTDKLIPMLETIKEAVIAGELDKQLAAAKQRRKRQKA